MIVSIESISLLSVENNSSDGVAVHVIFPVAHDIVFVKKGPPPKNARVIAASAI